MTNGPPSSENDFDSPNLNIRLYRPGHSRYASRIPESMWEKMRPDLERLHHSGSTRRQMVEYLAHQHDCRPTPSQLNARMVAWGLKAYKGLKAAQNDREASEVTETTSSTPSHSHTDSTNDEVENNMDVDILAESTDPLEDCVVSALRSEAILDPWNLCILQDVADVFGHSGWGSHISHTIMKTLVQSVELELVPNDPVARLLLLRNCILWPAWWSNKTRRDWFIECLGRMKAASTGRSDLVPCELVPEIAGPTCLQLDINVVDANIKECIPGINMGSQNWPYDNSLFLVSCGSLEVHYGNPDLAYRFDSFAAEDLLSWCAKQIGRFNPPSCLSLVGASCSGSRLLLCRIELMRHLFDRWNKFVAQDEVIVEEGRIDATGRAWSDDLFMFRIVARVLSIVSFLVTSTIETAFPTATSHTDPEFATKIKSALSAAMGGLQSCHIGIFEQMRSFQWSHPSIKAQDEEYCSINNYSDIAKDLAVVLAQQFNDLRQKPLSHRHLAALRTLRRQSKMKEPTQNSTGPDAMLWSVRSTSSFKSFRRAGISARDRFRPSSVSSITSRLSVSSSKSNCMMTAETIAEEWNLVEMDVDVSGNSFDAIFMSGLQPRPILQQ